jgi:RNA polymerase sigma factor (sigma-70 family)
LVRVPTYQLKKVREIRDAENALSRRLGRRPRREEISARLDRSLTKVDQVLQFNLRELSLDDKFGKDRDRPISDLLVDEHSINPENDLIKREATTLVAEAMSHLSEQERKVIAHRFGIQMQRPFTLKEIGEMMSISRERVRQIECQAKTRLRKLFARKRLINGALKPPPPGLTH